MDDLKGIVRKSTGSWFTVRISSGKDVDCRIKGKFRIKGIKNTNPVAVGDNVELEMEADGNGIITHIEERTNYIIRKATKLSKQTQIIASNIDQALLVVTLAAPETFTGFIDRFLVTAEAYSIPVTIVFNKLDIYVEQTLEYLEYLDTAYQVAGYDTLHTSATKGTNLTELKDLLKDKTSLLAGHSGVGKSTLVNAIEPQLQLKTGGISIAHLKGKHTTTFAEMFDLSFGGKVIDTPGIKGFGIIDFQKEELFHYFPEIFKISHDCKFKNCVHMSEQECAVKDAVEAGDIGDFRYENYLKMYHDEDTDLQYR